MPYYHVYIETAFEETEETDFSREQLLKDIVRPYSRHKQFLCKGVIIDPDEISAIRIFETEQPSSEILKKIRAEMGTGAVLVSDIFASDFELLEKAGKDVTREFLTVGAEKRRRRISRKKTPVTPSKNVFIVHGRDYEPVKELREMLSEFGLNPIVLHEQPSGSRTIVEKLEKYSDVGYAFVILTPDDFGSEMESLGGILSNPDVLDIEVVFDSKLLEKRARQNVVLEFGYFIGLLSRDRVCCLHTGDVELPSDMGGIVYIPFEKSVDEVKNKIIKELKAAGYEIKL